MFEALQGRLQNIITQLTGRGVLSESDVDAVLREVRLALLEADRKSTRLNSSHIQKSRMPSSA